MSSSYYGVRHHATIFAVVDSKKCRGYKIVLFYNYVYVHNYIYTLYNYNCTYTYGLKTNVKASFTNSFNLQCSSVQSNLHEFVNKFCHIWHLKKYLVAMFLNSSKKQTKLIVFYLTHYMKNNIFKNMLNIKQSYTPCFYFPC